MGWGGFTRNIINQMQKYMCITYAGIMSADDDGMCWDRVARNVRMLNMDMKHWHTLRTDGGAPSGHRGRRLLGRVGQGSDGGTLLCEHRKRMCD